MDYLSAKIPVLFFCNLIHTCNGDISCGIYFRKRICLLNRLYALKDIREAACAAASDTLPSATPPICNLFAN